MGTCQRQFYFQYCADARWDHPDPRRRELSLLKQVKAIAMWKGDVVHQALANYFRNLKLGRALSCERVVQFAEKLARTQWIFSKAGRYRKESRFRAGDAFAALLEHEYKIEDAESLDEAVGHLRTCLSNFYTIDSEQGISAAFREGRHHLVEPPAWGEGATIFTIPGIKVTVKVDLAFETKEGGYVIYDWKTGKGEEDATAQVELYAIWAHLSLGYPLDSISAYEVSLMRAALSCVQLTEPRKFYRLDKVTKSSELIKVLAGSDNAGPNLGDFTYARHVSTCRRCALQRVCREFP
jgi:hypothetical protein